MLLTQFFLKDQITYLFVVLFTVIQLYSTEKTSPLGEIRNAHTKVLADIFIPLKIFLYYMDLFICSILQQNIMPKKCVSGVETSFSKERMCLIMIDDIYYAYAWILECVLEW